MRTVMRCRKCGVIIGTVGAPSREELSAAAKGSPYAGMVNMIPADFIARFAEWLTFECDDAHHTMSGDSDNGSTQERTQQASGSEARDEAQHRLGIGD